MKSSKQQAIELAYVKLIGQEKFEHIKSQIDENGWCNYGMVLETNKFEFKDSNSNEFYRPLSLQGIETNNGWIKIESEKDLPSNESVRYYFYDIVVKERMEALKVPLETIALTQLKQLYAMGFCTHYKPQPISIIEPPIF